MPASPTSDQRPAPPPPPTAVEASGASAAAERTDAQIDPHRLAPLVAALSDADAEASRTAVAVLSVLLRDGEEVRQLVVGKLNGADGVVALTDQRLLLANDRAFKADALEFSLDSGIEVRGWQDAEEATIALTGETDSATVLHIADRSAAQRLAATLRDD